MVFSCQSCSSRSFGHSWNTRVLGLRLHIVAMRPFSEAVSFRSRDFPMPQFLIINLYEAKVHKPKNSWAGHSLGWRPNSPNSFQIMTKAQWKSQFSRYLSFLAFRLHCVVQKHLAYTQEIREQSITLQKEALSCCALPACSYARSHELHEPSLNFVNIMQCFILVWTGFVRLMAFWFRVESAVLGSLFYFPTSNVTSH